MNPLDKPEDVTHKARHERVGDPDPPFLYDRRSGGPYQLFALAFPWAMVLGAVSQTLAFVLPGPSDPGMIAEQSNNALAGMVWWMVLSAVFCCGATLLTRNSCSFRLALRYFLLMVGVAVVGGAIGALVFAVTSPPAIPPVPARRHLIVPLIFGGALRGSHLGSLVGLVLALVLLRVAWLRQQAREAARDLHLGKSEHWTPTPTPTRGPGIVPRQDGTREEMPEGP
jgi:membrane protein YqaA with SNARE-associated domain